MRYNSNFKGFVSAVFCSFSLDQKMTLKSFHPQLLVLFLTELTTPMKWAFFFLRKWNHCLKCRERKNGRFCVSSILHAQFRSNIEWKKVPPSLIIGFLTELTFLNQMSVFSRDWNHCLKCREWKECFQTIMVIVFWNLTMF